MKEFLYYEKTFSTIVGGRPLVVEVGEVAKQAAGSVLVNYGDSTVLSVAVAEIAETFGSFSINGFISRKVICSG